MTVASEMMEPKGAGERRTSCIEVTFGEPVRLSSEHVHRLVSLLSEICDAYQADCPDRVMWPAGIGDKPMSNWLAVDDEDMRFDSSVFHVECFERERFEGETCRKTQTYEFRVLNAAINRIGWPEINKFQDVLRGGQDHREDAGGFMVRAIKALFRIRRRDPVVTYQDAARAVMAATLSASKDLDR